MKEIAKTSKFQARRKGRGQKTLTINKMDLKKPADEETAIRAFHDLDEMDHLLETQNLPNFLRVEIDHIKYIDVYLVFKGSLYVVCSHTHVYMQVHTHMEAKG